MTPVLIMCGGRGQRLHPLTEKKPKPLLRVGTHPILETIVMEFAGQGFRKIWLAVNYHADRTTVRLTEGGYPKKLSKGVTRHRSSLLVHQRQLLTGLLRCCHQTDTRYLNRKVPHWEIPPGCRHGPLQRSFQGFRQR